MAQASLNSTLCIAAADLELLILLPSFSKYQG